MKKWASIDPHTDQRWARFIEGHPGSTVFHTAAWLRVLEMSYGFTPACLGTEENGMLRGILPVMEVRSTLRGRHGVSLPFSDHCGPLAAEQEDRSILLAACVERARSSRWRYCEVREFQPHTQFRGTESYRLHTVVLDPGPDAVYARFKKTQIQQTINKAVRNGVRVEHRTDAAAMDAFVKLNVLTRRKHGLPPQPDSFFRNLRTILLEPGHGFVSLALVGGGAVAASVCLLHNRTVFYKYNASEEAGLRCGANHLIVWDAIRWGCEQGYRYFDFGRTDQQNAGLVFFKRGWGSVESTLQYCRWDTGKINETHAFSRVLEECKPVIRKLPIPVLKILGKTLYGQAG